MSNALKMDNFYREFEQRHYADRETIKRLRRQYLPFLAPLKEGDPNCPVFDLGCGRGEWLELMGEEGFSPFGIDMDESMLQECSIRQLPAGKGDAVVFLKSLADESQAVVTAFHFVEHIRFDQLRTVVSESLRVLKPGGLLIMETPNPENISVATTNFYLDPTHQRPVPPQLLAFLTDYHGFARSKVLYLQESAALASNPHPSLEEVLSGVSPDYAVIAQKKASSALLARLDHLFDKAYGLNRKTLVERYDSRLQACETKGLQAAAAAQKADFLAQQLETRLDEVQVRCTQLAHEMHALRAQNEDSMRRIQALKRSRSWRIAAPLRELPTFAAGVRARATGAGLRKPILWMIGVLRKCPRIADPLTHQFIRHPAVGLKVGRLLQRFGIDYDPPPAGLSQAREPRLTLSRLDPRARWIYRDIKQAIGTVGGAFFFFRR